MNCVHYQGGVPFFSSVLELGTPLFYQCPILGVQFNVKGAVCALGLAWEVEYVTDMAVIAQYGVMSMPAIVVDEKVVSAGKVLSSQEVERLFHRLGY